MLVTLGISPSCFGIGTITGVEERYAAEAVLDAMLENAVVVTPRTDFIAALSTHVAALSTKLGQHLPIRAAELTKVRSRLIRSCQQIASGPAGVVQELVSAATAGADVLICGTVAEAAAVTAALAGRQVEVCTLSDYRASKTEFLRRQFLQSVELHLLLGTQCRDLIRRAVGGGGPILIADKMLGIAGKDGKVSKQMERFAHGVVYIAECASGGGTGGASIEILSVGGATGAKMGFVDPALAERAIKTAVKMADTNKVIRQLTITLKADVDPPLFRDRLLASEGRCWGVRHGVDDIGALTRAPNLRSPTYIDPDCPANRRLLIALTNLKLA